ncbi:DNA repair protein RecO [Novipirellula artificiosorum]|uniref:DNA repair protein RecO n=1 Tax=Novipirellula artificiosorum TaxID=2528016 RepID=A0A5C6DLZ2_9BACT|nr:DNA repair protein RecO [Novipirellula artificiosorum]TWU37195.1 DNA repair protein RecO [Novipirellula artificiosorum]
MSAEQTVAIVLRTIEFSETSLVVTLFTRDFGRLSGLAKGARRPKGPFEGSLDLLSVCRVVVLRKSTDALDLLTEAKLHRRFRGAERSLPRVYAGYYVAEILRLLTDDHDPHADVYDLTLATLNQIDGVGDVGSSILYYEAQLLRLLGHAPGIDRCTECGADVEMSVPRIPFALSTGGVVCRRCASRHTGVISVQRSTLEQLKQLLDTETRPDVLVTSRLYGELRAVMSRYIQTIVGKVPRTQHLLPQSILTASTRTEPTA